MDNGDTLLSLLKDWLVSAVGTVCLARLAEQACRHAGGGGGISQVWPYPQQDNPSPGERQEQLQEISHDFLAYLLGVLPEVLPRRPDLVLDLHNGQFHQVMDFLWGQFLNQWREKGRSRQNNFRGYLYRRAREAVTGSADFVTLPYGSWLVYALTEQPPRHADVLASDRIPYAQLELPPVPQGSSAEKVLSRKKYLADAAARMYRQLTWDESGPQYVAVRDLVTALAYHHPWVNLPLREELGEEVELLPSASAPCEDRLDTLAALSSITLLAAQAVRGFTRNECQALVWEIEGNPMPLREKAALLGLRDHNAALRLNRKVIKKLQRFVDSCPGPNLRDLSSEVPETFLHEICSHCEKMLSLPVREGK